MNDKQMLEEKMKLNLFLSIHNTKELIDLIKEYHSKFGYDGFINMDERFKFEMIKGLQEQTYDLFEYKNQDATTDTKNDVWTMTD